MGLENVTGVFETTQEALKPGDILAHDVYSIAQVGARCGDSVKTAEQNIRKPLPVLSVTQECNQKGDENKGDVPQPPKPKLLAAEIQEMLLKHEDMFEKLEHPDGSLVRTGAGHKIDQLTHWKLETSKKRDDRTQDVTISMIPKELGKLTENGHLTVKGPDIKSGELKSPVCTIESSDKGELIFSRPNKSNLKADKNDWDHIPLKKASLDERSGVITLEPSDEFKKLHPETPDIIRLNPDGSYLESKRFSYDPHMIKVNLDGKGIWICLPACEIDGTRLGGRARTTNIVEVPTLMHDASGNTFQYTWDEENIDPEKPKSVTFNGPATENKEVLYKKSSGGYNLFIDGHDVPSTTSVSFSGGPIGISGYFQSGAQIKVSKDGVLQIGYENGTIDSCFNGDDLVETYNPDGTRERKLRNEHRLYGKNGNLLDSKEEKENSQTVERKETLPSWHRSGWSHRFD